MKLWQWITAQLRACFPSGRQDDGEQWMQVRNLTRGNLLAKRVEVAASAKTRKKGLLGRDGLAPGEGLWIVPCESVHTFFMKFPIDLVYLDRRNRIRKLRSEVGPWRLSACLAARSVIELAPGTIRATEARRGDEVSFEPVSNEAS